MQGVSDVTEVFGVPALYVPNQTSKKYPSSLQRVVLSFLLFFLSFHFTQLWRCMEGRASARNPAGPLGCPSPQYLIEQH